LQKKRRSYCCKFTRQPYTITHLLELGAMNRLRAAYLWVLFDVKAFGLIIGEMGSGRQLQSIL